MDVSTLKLIGSGKTADVYRLDDEKVIKVYYPQIDRMLIENEYNAANLSAELGIASPKAYSLEQIDGRAAIVFDYVSGDTIKDLLTKHPLHAKKYGQGMADLQLSIHRIAADGKFPTIKKGYRTFILQKTELTDADKALVVSRLDALPEDTKLLHGDFHPENILMADGKPTIIDWSGAVVGSPIADVCGTYLIVKTSPLHKSLSRVSKMLMTTVVDKLLDAYLKRYFEKSGYTYADMEAWLPV